MAPRGGGDPPASSAAAIDAAFGRASAFKEEFADKAKAQRSAPAGRGW